MIFNEKKLNGTGRIYYLDHYHPLKYNGNKIVNDATGMILNVKSGVYDMKNGYHGIKCVSDMLGLLLTDDTDIVIISVPSSDPKKKGQGIELFTQYICKTYGWIDGTGLIYRSKDISQKNATTINERYKRMREKRKAEVQYGSLSFATDALQKLRGKRVLILDDVTTSGASFEGMRLMLKYVGLEQLEFLALGRAYNGYNYSVAGTSKPDSYGNKYVHLPSVVSQTETDD